MPTRALTTAAVARLKPPTQGQADYFDKGFPGLALRVSYGGSKTFVHFYRQYGKLRRLTLGRWPKMDLAGARDAWRTARKLVEAGEDPAHARPVQADSFGQLTLEWLKRDQSQNRSAAYVGAIMERYPLPAWGERPINTITRRDIIQLIDLVADRGYPAMVHRLHSHLHRLFRWAVGRDILDVNPMADLPRQGEVVKRDRVLTDAELALVWKASDDWLFGPLFRLLICDRRTPATKSVLCDGPKYGEIRSSLKAPAPRTAQPHTHPAIPAGGSSA